MENTLEIRFVEKYTVKIASKAFKINLNEFKNCQPAFMGQDIYDFMNYLDENV
ncbi:hypothetical protein OAF64_00730 [Crocinitomicaceae bacterium]|nr:hypothetical protein [Crocinitomicaceae bacterium]